MRKLTNLSPTTPSHADAHLFEDGFAGTLDPFAIFEVWLTQAIKTEINDPTAMALASVDEAGIPDVRMVLMNGRDRRGIVFFTNLNSAKGQQLQAHPSAAALFHWKSMRRQIRLRGPIERVTDAESDAYFATRPARSRIGAHASDQSKPLASRAELINRADEIARTFGDTDIPRPAHWSGFRLKPTQIEFWQDGEFRLHDRVIFTRDSTDDSVWSHARLNP